MSALRISDVLSHEVTAHMKFVSQLGLLVPPARNYTRFQHCLDTMGLAAAVCSALGVSGRALECVLCAAMLHDVGHGPYSHAFDAYTGSPHEERSCALVRLMGAELDWAPEETAAVTFLISGEGMPPGFLPRCAYRIVNSGSALRVDVDRVAYVCRDQEVFADEMRDARTEKVTQGEVARALGASTVDALGDWVLPPSFCALVMSARNALHRVVYTSDAARAAHQLAAQAYPRMGLSPTQIARRGIIRLRTQADMRAFALLCREPVQHRLRPRASLPVPLPIPCDGPVLEEVHELTLPRGERSGKSEERDA